MSLKRKIARYRKAQQIISELAPEIHEEGFAILRKREGLLAKPRLERIIQEFA